MSLTTRVQRLAPSLTARERGILVLGSLKNKTPEDPSWRSTMPPEQLPEFNRLIVLMNACNIYLPLYITMVELRVEQLYLRFYWWHSVVSLGQQTWELAQLVPAGKRSRAEAAVSDGHPGAELPWLPSTAKYSWLNMSDDMEETIRLLVGAHWQDVRAIEMVLDEVAVEFNGEDPLRPLMRDILNGTKARLSDLHELLSALEPFALQDPDEDAMRLARTYFERGEELMAQV